MHFAGIRLFPACAMQLHTGGMHAMAKFGENDAL